MKKISYFLAAFTAALTLGSCQVEEFDQDTPDTTITASHGFTLTAGYGDPASKAAFDDEGLGMSWTPGDKLVMIDPNGSNRPITLTTDITEPAKTAKFHTDELVATGSYIVVNEQNTLYAQLEEYPTLKSSPSGLNELIRLYGNVSVEKGQTSAEITLQHLYTMLSFKFSNIPDGFQSGLNLGIAVVTDGLPTLDMGTIGPDGLVTKYSGTFVHMLGQINAEVQYSLIAPADLRNNQIIFFAVGSDAQSNRHVYEIFKSGVKLNAGKCYSISFDFAAGSTKHVTLEHTSGTNGLSLKSADDFFAAALIQWPNSLHLQQDVDFSGEAFLPLQTSFLHGNGHKLSYIQCGLDHCDKVGVVSDGGVSDLTVVNSFITGRNKVGAIAGSGYCRSCTCSDIKIIGNEEVGGLVGSGNDVIENCSLLGTSQINGAEAAGGIVGSTSKSVQNCVAKGEITITTNPQFGSYSGGIAGKANGGAIECGFEGVSVNGAYYVGGVTGEGSCTRCYCMGSVKGVQYTGGVSGSSSCTDCYCIGTVYGSQIVRGITASSVLEEEVRNCYFCGDISANVGVYGICYSTKADYMNTNLASFGNLYSEDSPADLVNCRNFLNQLSVINGNGAYLDVVWPDNTYNCPILKWQYEGFGVDLMIPGYESIEL